MSSRLSRTLDRPWPVLLVVLVLAAGGWYLSSRPTTHTVNVAFSAALNVPEGALVEAAGVTVGHATDIRYEDGQALMRLRLEDKVWPLPRGTTAKIRLASISGNVNRRIVLVLGPRGAQPVRDGGVIGAAESKPVELDEIFNTFDAGARQALRGALTNTAVAVGGHTRQLNAGVHALGAAVPQAGGLLTDLHATQRSLSSLVHHGDEVTRVLAAKQGQVGAVVDLAAATFQTFGARSAKVRATLDALPPALAQVSATTRRLQPSLVQLTGLVRDLAPGARQLAPTAEILRPTLSLLRSTAADGARLADDATVAAPRITRLLRRGQPFVKDLTPIVNQLTPIIACVRPYTPELAGTLSNWASWNANYDAKGNVAKIFADTTGLGDFGEAPDVKAVDFAKFGLNYAALRPHGWIAGKPQFDDACGVGRAGVDPRTEWPDR